MSENLFYRPSGLVFIIIGTSQEKPLKEGEKNYRKDRKKNS